MSTKANCKEIDFKTINFIMKFNEFQVKLKIFVSINHNKQSIA